MAKNISEFGWKYRPYNFQSLANISWNFEKFLEILNFRKIYNPSEVKKISRVTRYLCTYSGGISMKLGTNNQHVSGNRWKGFQGQMSKVKVIAMPNALFTADGVRSSLFVNTYFTLPDISVISRGISMKFDSNIPHVSGHYWKGFQRSEVNGRGYSTFEAEARISWLCSLSPVIWLQF